MGRVVWSESSLVIYSVGDVLIKTETSACQLCCQWDVSIRMPIMLTNQIRLESKAKQTSLNRGDLILIAPDPMISIVVETVIKLPRIQSHIVCCLRNKCIKYV